MRTIFESHCEDRYFEAVGGKKLTNSFKYFHPDIELHFHGDAEIAEFQKVYPWMGWASMDPILMGRFAKDYDLIVHLDADTIVTGKLDEILIADYDLAGVRNNNDEGTASATRCIFGTHIAGIDARWQYLNAGLVAVHNNDFWSEFLDGVLHMPQHSGFGEQDVWNNIFWSGRYKTKILDPRDKPLYYGVSAQLSPPGQPMQYSWSKMYMKDGKLWLYEKEVKIIHHANGFGLPKLQYQDWVIPEVKDFLDTITRA
jgi:hypothetical protein